MQDDGAAVLIHLHWRHEMRHARERSPAPHPSVPLSAATSPRLLSPDSGDIKAFLCFRHRARPEPQPRLPFMAGAKSVTLAVYAEINQPGGGWVLPGSFAWMHS